MSIEEKLIKAAENNRYIYDKGSNDGYALGYDNGISTGYDEGYNTGYYAGNEAGFIEGQNAGKQNAYDDFWDIYQQNGNREHYSYAFGGYGWTDRTFKPKYDIVIGKTVSTNMFAYSEILDLKGILKKQNVILDTSQCTDLGSMFNGCSDLYSIPQIDASNSKHCNALFMHCGRLDDIDLKIKNDGTQTFTNTFRNCNQLYSLKIIGVIGESVDLKESKNLSKQSVINVVNALSSTTTGKSLTLHNEVRHWFNTTEWNNLINSKKNWTISLV